MVVMVGVGRGLGAGVDRAVYVRRCGRHYPRSVRAHVTGRRGGAGVLDREGGEGHVDVAVAGRVATCVCMYGPSININVTR